MRSDLSGHMTEYFGLQPDILEMAQRIDQELRPLFTEIEELQQFNIYKVIHAMRSAGLSDRHFAWNTGYGYNDIGREKTEEIFSLIFRSEDAIVRPTIANGTHALALCLEGILKSGSELISISGKPYDTLDQTIGITPSYNSLMERGVRYTQIELLENGDFDEEKIVEAIKQNDKPKMIYIQRSKGYFRRRALTIRDIEQIIARIRSIEPSVIVMIDNCYGEFMEEREPIEAGADLIAGSLIKNPGGGFALGGGYIAGRADLVSLVADRMTAPGIGKECGLTFGMTRVLLQGLFIAPMVVANAKKGAIFCAKLFEESGYETFPHHSDERSDIIQSVGLRSEQEIIAFCRGIQKAAPVDSFVMPEPWEMPGYDSMVIMAAGAFVQGSSIELSADAPIREPYTVYFQGGLTYEHSKLGAMLALQEIRSEASK
ncbi:MAG: methionine gamma-lyase family protein [Peptostreptococcaceae bacterium]|nr:methionine gamma-lyase family protein [Peptostreptococcaceae bacterium]